MYIVEVTLARPVLLSDAMKPGGLRRYTRNALIREVSPGTYRHEITSEEWNMPSHSWWLTVRDDGAAVLEIKQEWKNAHINIPGPGRIPQSYKEITYHITRPSVHFLTGAQREDNNAVTQKLFKLICSTRERVLPF